MKSGRSSFGCVTAALLVVLAGAAYGQQSTAWVPDADALPWQPRLIDQTDTVVCPAFENLLQEEFIERADAALPARIERHIFGPVDFALPWPMATYGPYGGGQGILERDFDGDGSTELMVQKISPRSGDDYREALVFESRAEFLERAQQVHGFSELFDRPAKPVGLGYLMIEDAEIVDFMGQTLLYRRELRTAVGERRTATLHGVAGTPLSCTVEIAPSQWDPIMASGMAEIADLRVLLHAISHVESSACGYGPSRYDIKIMRAEDLTLQAMSTVPWRYLGMDGQAEEARYRFVLRNLLDWGVQSAWNWRQLHKLAAAIPSAETRLGVHYGLNFGMPEETAATAAHRAIAELVSRAVWFAGGPFPKEDQHGYPAGLATYLQPEYHRDAFAALDPDGSDPAQGLVNLYLALLLDLNVNSLSLVVPVGNPDDEALEPILSFAIGDPGAMAPLIAAGADPNATNMFGKTALMYAAQLADIAAVQALLGYGADANLKTVLYDNCRKGPVIGGLVDMKTVRTALDYAIQSGSQEVIDLLRAHGAQTAEELAAAGAD
ncbi:MAG: ankyrin repeat domain-containing protein [Proteobacteria bacterium]|nr:ankyrin repeat domain-containing protein [Pseudomonadota bacterium]MDA0952339.1 ankyrin repeat domain-containing protein [Pseudomonadota bacterium]